MKLLRTIGLLAFLLMGLLSRAEPTKVIVRAKAKDAKFIGTSIGGAKVVIKNEWTGVILATGMTEGSTGNTGLIMKTPQERGMRITDEQTAKFETEIDLVEPVFVTVEVMAPFNKKQASVKATTQLWLIPGRHIIGEGIVVDIPGFVIDILKPQTHQFINMDRLSNKQLDLKANIVMMCGCTISNGGLWDATKMEVKGIVKLNGKHLGEVPLQIREQVNTFEGSLEVTQPGNYEITVFAYQQSTGNTGVDKVNFIIEQ